MPAASAPPPNPAAPDFQSPAPRTRHLTWDTYLVFTTELNAAPTTVSSRPATR